MKFIRQLAITEFISVTALVVVAFALSGLSALLASLAESSALSTVDSAKVVFTAFIIIGSLPVALYGAPLYTLLLHFSKATWVTVLAIGAAPGLCLLLFDTELGLYSLVCGSFVASITHTLARSYSNKSLNQIGAKNAPPG